MHLPWWAFLSTAAVCSPLKAAAVAAGGAALSADAAAAAAEEPQNANHIFNALHSSMRQWGSSLNHNGMSYFLANVPEGTQFYHGRSTKEPVKGMEWLAFEPEHALVFARPKPFGGPGGPGGPGGRPGKGRKDKGPPAVDDLEGPGGPPHHPPGPPGGKDEHPHGPPPPPPPHGPHEEMEEPGHGSHPPPPPHGPSDKFGDKHHGERPPPPPHGSFEEMDKGRHGEHPPPPPHGFPDEMKNKHHGERPPPPHSPFEEMGKEHHGEHPPPPPHGFPDEVKNKHHGERPPPPHGPFEEMDKEHHGQHPPPPPHGSPGEKGKGHNDEHPPPPPHGFPDEMKNKHHGERPPPHGPFEEMGKEHHGEHPPPPPHGFPDEVKGKHHSERPPPPHHESSEEKGKGRHGEHPPPPTSDSDPEQELSESMEKQRERWMRITHNPDKQEPISKIDLTPRGDEKEQSGYLHTYRTAHPLSLLYIDGMSAGKTEKGTLDSTDTVLADLDPAENKGMFMEQERAIALCNMSRDEWGGRIDGFLRMEMGFEIILCEFEKHLEVERITQVQQKSVGDPGKGGPKGFGGGSGFAYYQAVAARFDGIGGERVGLDYENFVSAFTYPADLFQGGEFPRLTNVSNETLAQIREDVTDMVLSYSPAEAAVSASTNWQSIADMYVTRFSPRLKNLALGEIESLADFRKEIESLLRPFIDYSARNSTLETARCAAQFMPGVHKPGLAAHAITAVASKICGTLASAAQEDNYATATASIQSLTDWLQWSTWKRCSGCDYNEVCFIPIWPSGRKQDYYHPMCQKSIPQDHDDNYWGGMGRPPRRGNGSDDEHPHYPPPPPGAWDGKERPAEPRREEDL